MFDTIREQGILWLASQGFFLSLLLVFKKPRILTTKCMAGLVFIVSVYLSMRYYVQNQFYYKYPHLLRIDIPFLFLAPPLLYHMVLSLLRSTTRLTRRDLWHCIPALLVAVCHLPIYLRDGESKIKLFEYLTSGWNYYLVILNFAGAAQLLTYCIVLVKKIKDFHKKALGHFSDDNQVALRLIKVVIITAMSAAVAFLVFVVCMLLGVDYFAFLNTYLVIVFFLFIVSFFSVGYYLLCRSDIYEHFTEMHRDDNREDNQNSTKNSATKTEDNLSEEETMLIDDLKRSMTREKPYLDYALTANKLAERLSISHRTLSRILNVGLEKNFFNFVNEYRVENLKTLLADPNRNHESIFNLALASGFNSKSALNAVFKKQTGITPSQYRKRM